ncbi:UNVERIFIED_CONTAM: hypothetical protein FKN15_012101 [Acipenser sinensis]
MGNQKLCLLLLLGTCTLARDCSLSEVAVIDPQGQLIYRLAPNTDEFKAAMAKNVLKFSIQGGDHVSLYPDSGEPENILNVKRGIITALMAPMESDKNIKTIPMDTVYGKCDSELTVNTRKADSSATDITVTRDLIKCQSFDPMRGYVSPLALITGMVKQTLKFVEVSKINNRYFDQDESAAKPLAMGYAEDKSPIQTKEAILKALRDLQGLAETQKGQQRASLFHKLVTELRGLNNKTLGEMVPEMTGISRSITLQALPQCGTPECIGAVLQVLRVTKAPTPVVDAVTYSLGLLPSPCNKRVRETLNMAQYQQSRATLYALSHTVRNRDFANIPLFYSYQVRSILLRVFQENSGKVQKRVAAYLMLMKNPSQSDLSKVTKALLKENGQVKSFVASHIANILESEEPSVQDLKRKVEEALKGNQLPDAMDFRKFSRNYHVSHTIPDNIFGFEPLTTTVGGNMVFDSTGYMPREAMLETTLQAFGNTIDMFEFGLDGNGFEPSLDALFGEKGFFPDSALKAMYWVNNKLPDSMSEVLKNWFGQNKDGRAKREIPEDVIKEITHNAKKLMKDLKSQDSPEATAYLRILGAELGYLKISDFKAVAEMIMNFGKELQGLPNQVVKAVTSGTDMDLFAHYIFMDNEFSLPTGAGLPLKFSLSGVFTPGARAGLKIDPKTKQLTFRPSLAVEFITQMGVQIPEFTTNGIQMHTNIYHESGVNAKVSIKGQQVKLSIPAPQGPTQLFSISNTLLSLSTGQSDIVPPIVESRTNMVTCNPMFPGLQYCTTVRYSNASMTDAAPYYPLTGETRFAFEIQPTGEVTEYSATIAYELLKEDRDKVDTVKLIVKAEGSQGSEAMATMKYNRNKMTISSDLQIPDYDVQVGINVGVKDEGMFKGKKTYGLNIGVSNKNIPELTLLGKARFEGMKEGQILVQLTIPRINVDGKASATVNVANGLTVQLDATANIPESSSAQQVIFRYGNNDDNVSVNLAMNGEANLEFLNTPVTIPEIKIPYTSMKTRLVKDVSLWQDTGLKNLLLTPRQSFDLTFKVQYQKNKDMHLYAVNLEPVYNTINYYVIESFNQNFEGGRDKVVTLLTNSYNKANEQYRNLKIDTAVNKIPKTFRIPGYTVPLLNIEVSPFIAELPAFGFVIPKEVSTPGFTVPMIGFSMPSYTLVLPSLELPVLHVPATLQKLTLPKFKVPRTQDTILVPAMGNITYDFAFKSAVITLNANAGIYNQSDITARFSAVASSVFDVLSFKLDGTTSLTRQRGLKLATALSLSHQNIEGAHDSTLSLTKRFIDASVTTTSKVKLPGINLEFKQELKGNSKSKPNVASKMNLKYNFKVPQIDTNGKGTVDHTLTLEGLTSYFSLDTTTKGNIEGIFLTTNTFSGKINNEASTYLNSNGIRSTIKTNANSKVDSKKSKIWNFDLNENLALEASPLRLYAMWNHTGSNEAIISRFNTKGNQAAKAILELVPTSMKADLQLVVSQPSSLVEEASIHHTVAVNINSENQKLGWNGKQQFMSKILAHDFLLSNDDSEVRFDVTGSMQGHVTFLKDITLPIYEKNIWELLRFDLTTSEDKLQYLNGSTTIVYTKNKDGYFFPMPINVLADGVTINIPEVTLQIPKWVRNLPRKIREIDIPIDNFKIPERVSIPSVIVTPVFKVPLTSIQVPSYTIDFKKIKIPKKISSLSFDLTLPNLPKVKFPKVDIAAQYLNSVKSKLPQFSVAVPDFKIIITSFTLPKTFTVGSHVIEMDKVVNQIANFDLPTITIPEQKIEIPEISVSLPAGLFIPVFGALSTTVKVASPIYNMSWTTSLENKTSSMVSSVKSTCSSTMVFLEYDLEASATTSYQDGAFKLDGKCTLSHNDLSIDWRHAYNLNNQRPKHHLLNVDITSPTFTDISIRYAAGMDIITASVSSPSAGFLGLLLEKTGPELIHGKLYSRYPSSPENDVSLLDAVVSVKNPEKLHVEAFWNRDGPYLMLEGLNQRIPKMASAVYSCINKYHHQHFGIDINRLSVMLKDNIQNYIETVYRETSKKIDELDRGLRNMVKYASSKYEQMKDKTKNIYKRAADNMARVDLQDLSSKFYDASIDLTREYQKNIKDLLDATIQFLRVTKFQLPGFNQRHTGQELFNKAADSASVMIDKILQQVKHFLQQYTDALIKYINDMEIKVPGTDTILQGKEVLDSIKDYLRKVQNEVIEAVKSLRKVNLEKSLKKLKDFFQTSFMRVEEVIKALKTKNLEEIKVQVQGMYNDAINSPLAAQIKYALDYVKDSTTRFYEFTQTCLKYSLEELEKTSRYVKSLREEYLDANMVGWTVKYYEIEEKMIELVKSCAEYVKETGPKYIEQVIAYVTQLTEKLKELVDKQGTEYLNYAKDLLTDADGRGMKMISELSNKAQAQIHEWSTLAKNIATEYRDNAQLKLQEAYGNLSLDELTSEAKRLFDIIIQQYSAYYQAILEILKELNNNIQPYIQYRDEKLQLDVPLPFLWESFDELPKRKER